MNKHDRMRAGAAALLLAAGLMSSAAAAAVRGDLNSDGRLDRSDAAALRDALLGKSRMTAEMDFDGDGRICAKDLTLMKRGILFPAQADDPQQGGIKDYGTPMNANATMVSDFKSGQAGDFFASDGWTNGDPFNCGWYRENTKIADGSLQLTIDRDSTGKYAYSGAEYRTNQFYHYGYYETSMQAIKNDGVVSSFFTYTGPSDNNPWDEIDIEILGKDTTKVQFNYYKDRQGGHEFMYDLGFDASEGYHTYGFDWQPDHITWYVDGKEAHTMWGSMPNTPGRIMMNTWPGIGVNEWLKAYDGKTPLTARYQWVTYKKS